MWVQKKGILRENSTLNKKSLATFRLKPSTAIQSDDAKKLLFAIFLNASPISSTYFPASSSPCFLYAKVLLSSFHSKNLQELNFKKSLLNKKSLATTYFPAKSSIIGARELDFRVRNGNGYYLSAMVTRH